jgi:hypothetical protein
VVEEFTLGARVSCPDGFCGVVSGTIVDPAARTVTHLVIEPVASVEDGIRLNVTKREVEDLPPLGQSR